MKLLMQVHTQASVLPVDMQIDLHRHQTCYELRYHCHEDSPNTYVSVWTGLSRMKLLAGLIASLQCGKRHRRRTSAAAVSCSPNTKHELCPALLAAQEQGHVTPQLQPLLSDAELEALPAAQRPEPGRAYFAEPLDWCYQVWPAKPWVTMHAGGRYICQQPMLWQHQCLHTLPCESRIAPAYRHCQPTQASAKWLTLACISAHARMTWQSSSSSHMHDSNLCIAHAGEQCEG